MLAPNSDNMHQMSQSSAPESLDALIDFSGGDTFETMSYNNTPSMSPRDNNTFSRSAGPVTVDTVISSSQQPMSGPSHQYDLYKNQTGIPSGAIANTFAMNQDYNNYGYSTASYNQVDDFNDFKPQQGFNSGIDVDAEPAYFYPEQSFINPSTIEESQPMPSVMMSQPNNVNRFFPGMHSQQALAKAQAQQKQQQQLIQRQNSIASSARHSRNNSKTDPMVDDKISQLLNSMRQSSVATSEGENSHLNNLSTQRMRKDEEDMDEDERLLASEEGKKLSSKERRQLRNKVSARAFRSRRKEYIGQLEGEIAVKINENSDLRSQNRALLEENKRLSDLTRMLLSSESFSGFFDNLSSTQVVPVVPQQQVQPKVEPRQQQMHKDINPYQPHMQMAMIPEQSIDFNMLDLGNEAYSYQPQVFSVLEVPEPAFEASILSGKTSSSGFLSKNTIKVDMPLIERLSLEVDVASEPVSESLDEDFNNDPSFALYHTSTAAASSPLSFDLSAISSKLPITITTVATGADSAAAAMQRVQRLCSDLDALSERLESHIIDY